MGKKIIRRRKNKKIKENEKSGVIIKGIIYVITNIINGKFYVGKTKTHRGDNIPYGIEGRMKSHMTRALGKGLKSRECPLLYNAIAKYGEENFIIEEILQCGLEDVNDYEIEKIAKYDSANRKNGYNIALGGGGRSVVEVSEETRKKISLGKNGKDMNLRKIYKNGVLAGYIARRIDKGKTYTKWFTSTKNTPKKNKKLANEWLKNLRKGIMSGDFYNKESKLPSNISIITVKGKLLGYRVTFTKNYKTIYKQFQSKTVPLPKLLKKAVKFRDDYLKNISEQSKN